MKRVFFLVLIILIAIYLIICVAIYSFQRKIIFLPSRGGDPPPDGLNISEVYFPTAEGQQLHGWWMPVDSPEYTIVFFHGNAGCVSNSEERMQFFRELGYSALIIDYRGYGKSTGEIRKEEDIYADAKATLAYVEDRLKIPEKKLIIWGWSLGGGVTTEVCQNIHPAAVVLEGTFFTMDEIAGRSYPLFPVKFLLNFHFNSGEKIKNFKSPVFFIHSKNDHTIPFEQGRRLFDAAVTRKGFLEIDGSHNHGYHDYKDEIIRRLKAFLETDNEKTKNPG